MCYHHHHHHRHRNDRREKNKYSAMNGRREHIRCANSFSQQTERFIRVICFDKCLKQVYRNVTPLSGREFKNLFQDIFFFFFTAQPFV